MSGNGDPRWLRRFRPPFIDAPTCPPQLPDIVYDPLDLWRRLAEVERQRDGERADDPLNQYPMNEHRRSPPLKGDP